MNYKTIGNKELVEKCQKGFKVFIDGKPIKTNDQVIIEIIITAIYNSRNIESTIISNSLVDLAETLISQIDKGLQTFTILTSNHTKLEINVMKEFISSFDKDKVLFV